MRKFGRLGKNIYLDAFDQEMKRRGQRIVRYADDILVLLDSFLKNAFLSLVMASAFNIHYLPSMHT